MSRKRYISTDISTDIRLAELSEHGTLPLLLYTWAIPHMDDWGRMPGDARQFKLLVCPALDVSSKEVDEALSKISEVGLWERYEVNGKKYICIPSDRWFKHQSYINKAKRVDDSGSSIPSPLIRSNEESILPRITEEHRETPNNHEDERVRASNTVSFSPSPTPSLSPSPSNTSSRSSRHSAHSVFGLYEREIGPLTEITTEILIDLVETYGEEKVKEAIKEAVRQGVKKLSYIEGILQDKPKPNPVNNRTNTGYRGGGSRKAVKPNVITDDIPEAPVTDEEYERIMRELKELEARKNRGP